MPTNEEVKNITQQVIQLALELQDEDDLERLVREVIKVYLENIAKSKGEK